jgi:hypothetical protein
MARQATNEVTDGLETKSAKIRALAHAGYGRAEIARALGIRYQHVRNILIKSGNAGGGQAQIEVEREPVTVEAAPGLPQAISCDQLLKAGFRHLGEWTADGSGAIKLNAQAPAEPGVYAFVIEDMVVYVGLTNSGLRTRFDQYRRGHKGQRTSARIKGQIINALSSGQQIKVMIATPGASVWNGLPVNTAAGLEGGLIQAMRPAWNILGAAQ